MGFETFVVISTRRIRKKGRIKKLTSFNFCRITTFEPWERKAEAMTTLLYSSSTKVIKTIKTCFSSALDKLTPL